MRITYKGFKYEVMEAFIKQPGFAVEVRSTTSAMTIGRRLAQDGEVVLILKSMPAKRPQKVKK